MPEIDYGRLDAIEAVLGGRPEIDAAYIAGELLGSLYVSRETTDATPTLIDLPLPDGCMSAINGSISAVNDDGTIAAAYTVSVAIAGSAGSYRIVDDLGGDSVNFIGADVAAADWTVTLGTTADGLGITVTGDTAVTVKWVANLTITGARWSTP